MRRFSQRNQLVTLSEINVTPLLDLAFVLLIIFVITTPLLEQGLDLRLPVASSAKSPPNDKDVVTAEVSPDEVYSFRGRKLASLRDLEQELARAHHDNTNVIVAIRAHRKGAYELPISVIDACQRQGITRFKLLTEPKGGQ
jgi:biopolymer transport protein ExbD